MRWRGRVRDDFAAAFDRERGPDLPPLRPPIGYRSPGGATARPLRPCAPPDWRRQPGGRLEPITDGRTQPEARIRSTNNEREPLQQHGRAKTALVVAALLRRGPDAALDRAVEALDVCEEGELPADAGACRGQLGRVPRPVGRNRRPRPRMRQPLNKLIAYLVGEPLREGGGLAGRERPASSPGPRTASARPTARTISGSAAAGA
jgi:hypothetical protein